MVRRVAACVVLGLPAALLAHAAVFGGSHAAGAGLNGFLLNLALGAVGLAVALYGIRAAARTHSAPPPVAALAISAIVWLAVIELLLESAHALPLVPAALAAFAAAWLVRFVLQVAASWIARVIISLEPGDVSFAREQAAILEPKNPLLPSLARRFRIFSRPPPAFS